MKKNCFKLLYKLFSFLSDQSHGASLFVNFKILFGTLLIGVISTSCNRYWRTCYKQVEFPNENQLEQQDPTEHMDTLIECHKQVSVDCYTQVDSYESIQTIDTTSKTKTEETF